MEDVVSVSKAIPGDRIKLNHEGARFFNQYPGMYFSRREANEDDIFTVVKNEYNMGFLRVMDNNHETTCVIYPFLTKVESGQLSLPFKERGEYV